ncbi:hypothetical protein VN97_g2062 [Penicillium thymicola]|uniref:Uncharacterized protein n=1 Tax=Penicillium thymicola TaxID=293382 RepID=A0AAI9XBN5_PENTH|nr:hypothetical protein VN97_g2062 [Penicillium thymicola]
MIWCCPCLFFVVQVLNTYTRPGLLFLSRLNFTLFLSFNIADGVPRARSSFFIWAPRYSFDGRGGCIGQGTIAGY